MPLDRDKLMGFLGEIDRRLETPIEVTAVGGTAMTLLDIKSSTIDIDFDFDEESLSIFNKTIESMSHGYKIDLFREGFIFSQQLPDDYVEKRLPIEAKFKKLKLYALHPIDIVVTKIGRLNDRDVEDIRSCIKKYNLTKEDISQRASQIEYVGREEDYSDKLRYVLDNLF